MMRMSAEGFKPTPLFTVHDNPAACVSHTKYEYRLILTVQPVSRATTLISAVFLSPASAHDPGCLCLVQTFVTLVSSFQHVFNLMQMETELKICPGFR